MSQRTIRAVGFDLGETLLCYRDLPLSWASLYPEALAAVATACRCSPSAEQIAAAKQILTQHNTRIVPRTLEIPAATILSSILHAWKRDSTASLNVATEAFFTFFQQHMCAYPESADVLTALRAANIPTGILTDVPYGMPRDFVQRDIDGAGIAGLFDVLLTSVEVGVRKPESTGYHALARSLGVEPHEMLYVGNEPKDVIGARRAGSRAAFVDRKRTGENHGQDFTISHLGEIHRIGSSSSPRIL
jgi:putative hydrolase of the HAD superfamily